MAEVAIGACVMAFPVAITEEVWNLGSELSLLRSLLFAAASVLFLALTVLLLHHREASQFDGKVFMRRVLGTYGFTVVISALLLFGIGRLGLFEDPVVAVNRTVLLRFRPASPRPSSTASAIDSPNPANHAAGTTRNHEQRASQAHAEA